MKRINSSLNGGGRINIKIVFKRQKRIVSPPNHEGERWTPIPPTRIKKGMFKYKSTPMHWREPWRPRIKKG